MKKYLYYSALLSIIFLSSCNTNGEDTLDPGYYTIQASLIPTSGVSANDYTIKFNDRGVDGTSIIVPRNNATGKLEVYKIGEATPEYSSEEMTIKNNQTSIQFIKLPGKQIAVYNADDYVSFNLSIIYTAGQEEGYAATFNGMELVNGNENKNYIKKADGLTDTLKIYKKGESKPVFAKKMTIEEASSINVMQLSTDDFVSIAKDDEPDPESKQYTKIRFFYTQDAIPGVKTVRMIIYSYNYSDGFTTQVGGPIEFNSGEFSPYVQLEKSNDQVMIYDLIDKATDKKIVDNVMNTMTYIPVFNYKKQTSRITDTTGNGGDNVVIQILSDLSIPW